MTELPVHDMLFPAQMAGSSPTQEVSSHDGDNGSADYHGGDYRRASPHSAWQDWGSDQNQNWALYDQRYVPWYKFDRWRFKLREEAWWKLEKELWLKSEESKRLQEELKEVKQQLKQD